jgi:hypothetical protein
MSRVSIARTVRDLGRFAAVVVGLAGTACSAADATEDVSAEALALRGFKPKHSPCKLVPHVPAFLQHCGDVTIASQADADQYQGVKIIVGDLTIRGGNTVVETHPYGNFYAPGVEIALPDLVQVTGTLDVDGEHSAKVDLPNLARVGDDLSVFLRRYATIDGTTVNLKGVTELLTPSLARVGGDVSLKLLRETPVPAPTSSKQYEFGLDQVTYVGGNITVEDDVLPAAIHGLRGLTTVRGNLSIDWKSNDLDTTNLLPNVTHVMGDVALLASHNARYLMQELTKIGGSLSIAPSAANSSGSVVSIQFSGVFPKLEKIGGDFILDRAAPDCSGTEFPALKKVRGQIILQNASMSGHMGVTGSAALNVGGIEIRSSTGTFPFFPDLKVRRSGHVVLEDNPDICSCSLANFESALAAAGWTGTVDLVGTNGSQACSPCPSCP